MTATIEASWQSIEWIRHASGEDLFRLAAEQLGLATTLTCPFSTLTAVELGNVTHAQLVDAIEPLFPSGTSLAEQLADQIQIARAFERPEDVNDWLARLVASVVERFPRTAADIKVGGNPGDVLDPFILSANFELLSGRDLTRTIDSTTSHKVLMKVEDLVGNLHQTTAGMMRGNFRVPEPLGDAQGKEQLHHIRNPFPGADVGQVPLPDDPDAIRLFQVKNKTGSAKGGDGKRLGEQLRRLESEYGARTFYAAVVGNTLRGHRSKGAVLRESPNTAVVVGSAALNELTQSLVGGEFLLRVYQRAFRAAVEQADYDFAQVVLEIAGAFEAEATAHGEDFLTAWLHVAIGGPASAQDSRKTP